jgi:hypothetical protein
MTQGAEQTGERHKINRVTYNPENGKTESKDDENYEVYGKGQGGNNKMEWDSEDSEGGVE